MNNRDHPQTSDHLEAALEASCDTLVTLQLIRSRGGDDVGGAEGHVTRAIRSLRRAIAELRLAGAQDANALALGFVANSGSGAGDP
jgi:hypothetical protein